MTKLNWDTKPHPYESGVDRGVFYPKVGPGQVWNGLMRVTETPTGAITSASYYDGRRIERRKGNEFFEGTIEAFTYPPSFYADILTQKRSVPFGMTYRVMSPDRYRIHIIYNILTVPSQTVYDQGDAQPFSWNFTTLPEKLPSGGYSAHLIIDTGIAYPWTVAALEDILYGTADTDPRLPLPEELITVIEANAILIITDYGDGTWSAEGPDEVVDMVDGTSFFIDWPSVDIISSDTYTVYTL